MAAGAPPPHVAGMSCAFRPPPPAGCPRRPAGVVPRAAASAVALLFLAACSPRPAADSRAADPPLRIIDAHVHTHFVDGPDPLSGLDGSRAGFLASMRRAGVVGAVAMDARDGTGYVDLSAEGVIHCGGVPEPPDTVPLAVGLADGRYKCLKIYLGYVSRTAADPAYEPVYALAAHHHVPVVFHTGDTSTPDGKVRYSDPLPIDEVAVDHRDVRFVIAHAGNPWIQTAAEIAYKNPNVYIEASALMVGDPAKRDTAWVRRYVEEPISWVFGYIEDPTKMMFGTDWPLVDMAGYVEAYKRAIPREHWQAVFHDNAARVFGMEGVW
jgi:uncharacterized protein